MNHGDAWSRPAAGREPAAAALLGWLEDFSAPRLCLVSGGAGCGKSSLLAWLVRHGAGSAVLPERRVHAFVPLEGRSVLGTVWMLADQLGVVARALGELVASLDADDRPTTIVLPDLHAGSGSDALVEMVLALRGLEHVRLVVEARSGSAACRRLAEAGAAVMDLDDHQWTDPVRYENWRAADTADAQPAVSTGQQGITEMDLDDPAALCAADPLHVTTAFETDTDEHGGLRTAWLRAGQSLCRDQEPADRALVLLTALGDSADPRLSPDLRKLAGTAGWQPRWSRVRGDVTPPWPGPVLALATGLPSNHVVLLADHQGTLRMVSTTDGAPSGRLALPVAQPKALAVLDNGPVLVLNSSGHLHAQTLPTAPRSSGIEALLNDGPTAAEQLTAALSTWLTGISGTAIAASSGLASVGDSQGRVHAFNIGAAGEAPRTARLHTGRVTALSAVSLPAGDDVEAVTLVYSGGADGTVRAWAPTTHPLRTPVAERGCPVAALSAADTRSGPALAIGWTDGTVELLGLDTGQSRLFRPGAPVNALALNHDEDLLVGMDDRVICLRPRWHG